MSRIFITIGSAHSKAANVNPVDGIWCSDCGWARVWRTDGWKGAKITWQSILAK